MMILVLILCVFHHVYTIIPNSDNGYDFEVALSDGDLDHDDEITIQKDFDDSYYVEQYEEPRRLFSWINNIFKRKKSNAISRSSETKNDVTDERIKYYEIERNLTETLTKLEHILRQILDIVKYTRQDNFKKIEDFIPKDRQKRNVNETAKTSKATNQLQVIPNIVTNTTDKVNSTRNDTQINSRRSFRVVQPMDNDEIKIRLLHYITEGFNEIKNKVNSLTEIRTLFSNDVNFRIGYIIANIDVLELNMNNLKQDMTKQMYVWNDAQILNLYDTVKTSSNAISSLLEVLKKYGDKLK